MNVKQKKYKIIKTVTLIITFSLFIFPAIFFLQLPEEIPIHFGIQGKPDNYSSKNNIWIIPVLGLLFYVASLKLEKILLSEFSKKTSFQVAFMIKNLRILLLVILSSFLYITIQLIFVALEKSEGLGAWFIYAFFFSILVFPLLPLIRRNKTI